MKPFRYGFLLFVWPLVSGCGTTKQSAHQLERVAKDWCLSVRASQIIPVYPLTEDVEPGDVFLVQTPYEDQIKVYESKGFLPLENLVTRLHPQVYSEFYSKGYGITGTGIIPPRLWQFPPPPGYGRPGGRLSSSAPPTCSAGCRTRTVPSSRGWLRNHLKSPDVA